MGDSSKTETGLDSLSADDSMDIEEEEEVSSESSSSSVSNSNDSGERFLINKPDVDSTGLPKTMKIAKLTRGSTGELMISDSNILNSLEDAQH